MKDVFKDVIGNPILRSKDKIVMSANIVKYKNRFYMYVEERDKKFNKKFNTTPNSIIAVYDSNNLINWKRIKTLLEPKYFNCINLEAPCAIIIKGKIYLYYNSYNGKTTSILLTILKDPITIERNVGIVLKSNNKNDLDYPYVKEPDVIKFKNKYLMFYEGTHNCKIQKCSMHHGKKDPQHARVLLAESKNGINWIKKGKIIDHWTNNWNKMHSSPGGAVILKSRIYLILNGANKEVSKHKFKWAPFNIGIATSKDGTSWTISKTPVLKSGSKQWKRYLVFSSCLIRKKESLYLFYQADDTVVALAKASINSILKSKLFK